MTWRNFGVPTPLSGAEAAQYARHADPTAWPANENAPRRANRHGFIDWVVMPALLAFALWLFLCPPAAKAEELVTCKQLVSSDGMLTVDGATYGSATACPNIVTTKSSDLALGTACTLTNGVMGCSIGEPIAEVPQVADVKMCTATSLPSPGELLAAEVRVTIWSVHETCTPLPLGSTPHRVVKLNANGFSVCIMPGSGCVAVSTLGTKALTRLANMGIGGVVGTMLEQVLGQKKAEKA